MNGAGLTMLSLCLYNTGLQPPDVAVHSISQEADLKIPVVILTSSQSSEDVAAAYDLGANAYLVKPSDTVKLAELAKSIKVFWLTHSSSSPSRYQPFGIPSIEQGPKRPRPSRTRRSSGGSAEATLDANDPCK